MRLRGIFLLGVTLSFLTSACGNNVEPISPQSFRENKPTPTKFIVARPTVRDLESKNLDFSTLVNQIKINAGFGKSKTLKETFIWTVPDNVENDIEVEGVGFEVKNVDNYQVVDNNRIVTDLISLGFRKDSNNIGTGILTGSAGYRQNDIVCTLQSDQQEKNPTKSDISFFCGQLKRSPQSN
jgi:hypothetical protein